MKQSDFKDLVFKTPFIRHEEDSEKNWGLENLANTQSVQIYRMHEAVQAIHTGTYSSNQIYTKTSCVGTSSIAI